MPLVRLRTRVLAAAFASVLGAGCSPVPPPVPPADPTVTPSLSPAPRTAAETGPSVSGRVTTDDDSPLTSAAVIMRSLDEGAPAQIATDDVRLLPDGSFEFRNVAPGRYEIRARGATAARPSLSAVFRVTVSDRHVTNVQLRLIPGATLQGRVEVDPGESAAAPGFAALRVRAPFADGSSFGDAGPGAVGADGSFTVRGLMAGSHFVTVEGLPDPWIVSRVRHSGRDVSDSGIDVEGRAQLHNVRITISTNASQIAGLVLDGDGAGVGGAAVVVLPGGAERWNPASRRMRSTRTDAAGRYRIRGLPAGDYRIAAALLDESVLHRAEVFERMIAAGSALTLTGEESRTVDLRLASVAAPWQPSLR